MFHNFFVVHSPRRQKPKEFRFAWLLPPLASMLGASSGTLLTSALLNTEFMELAVNLDSCAAPSPACQHEPPCFSVNHSVLVLSLCKKLAHKGYLVYPIDTQQLMLLLHTSSSSGTCGKVKQLVSKHVRRSMQVNEHPFLALLVPGDCVITVIAGLG